MHGPTRLEQDPAPVDQHNPQFLEWLRGNDAAFELFFEQDAPQVATLDNPWTLAGLQVAVSTAREIFPDHRAVIAPGNRPAIDRFGRFVGEVFVRQFEGQWCNAPDNAPIGVEFWPTVECRDYLACITPHSTLEIAIVEGRTKEVTATENGTLTGLFENVRQRYLKWVADQPAAAASTPLELAS